MKMCARHFEQLKAQLVRKSLWALVSTDTVTMKYRAESWLTGRATVNEVDPLVISILELNAKAVQYVGTHIRMPKASGEHYCPCCEIDGALRRDAATSWIDNCTDAVMAVCIANGLLVPN